jgi:hypothetical protein
MEHLLLPVKRSTRLIRKFIPVPIQRFFIVTLVMLVNAQAVGWSGLVGKFQRQLSRRRLRKKRRQKFQLPTDHSGGSVWKMISFKTLEIPFGG